MEWEEREGERCARDFFVLCSAAACVVLGLPDAYDCD